jgi:hypothetical protein
VVAVPLGVGARIVAALHIDGPIDRIISQGRVAGNTVPKLCNTIELPLDDRDPGHTMRCHLDGGARTLASGALGLYLRFATS